MKTILMLALLFCQTSYATDYATGIAVGMAIGGSSSSNDQGDRPRLYFKNLKGVIQCEASYVNLHGVAGGYAINGCDGRSLIDFFNSVKDRLHASEIISITYDAGKNYFYIYYK